MLLTNNSLYKYNPSEMSQDDFLAKFVVRIDIFQDIFQDIKSTDYKVGQQHYIIVGQRGQGKTTILRKLQLEILNDTKLAKFLIPIRFPEELYNIRNLEKLWEEVADILQSSYGGIFPDIYNKLEKHFEDDDYYLKVFGYLEEELKKQNKKLVLFLDNIDEFLGKLKPKEQKQLREILISSSSFRIIGASTKMFEQQYDYSKPFYEFFKIIKLNGLDFEDSKKFILALGNKEQKKHIQKILKDTPKRLESLRILTTGVPRTLVILYEIFLDDSGDSFNDLLKILDEVTPLYKHRMDDLPTILQDIVHTLAMNWDGMLTSEIAKKTKLESKSVSSQLKQLEKYEIIESIKTGKNKIYMIKERFFNIWYLMRFGRKSDRQRVEWLVQFLNSWCSKDELDKRAKKLINYVQNGNVNNEYAFFMCEALSYAGIGVILENDMKNVLREYLDKNGSLLSEDIAESDFEFYKRIRELRENNKIDEANDLILTYDKSNENLLIAKSIIYSDKNKYKEAKKILKALLNKGSKHILVFDNLLKILINENILSQEVTDIATQGYNIKKTHVNTSILLTLHLHLEEFEKSYKLFIEFLNIQNSDISTDFIKRYLLALISFKQYHKTKEFLELPKHNLKEKFKAIWYVLMYFMQDEYPNEYKKMGSELKQSVEDMIKSIKK